MRCEIDIQKAQALPLVGTTTFSHPPAENPEIERSQGIMHRDAL
jgi:hypothetical protein